MKTTTPPRTPRPTRQQLGGQVRAVVADLPLFLTAPLFRRWHLRWGATPGEVEAALPGDELLPNPQFRCTRPSPSRHPHAGLAVAGPGRLPSSWLHSNDLLDNLGHPSAHDIVPELQQLEVGQWIPMSPTPPSDVTALRVEAFEINQWLLWHKPDSTWVWQLTDTGHGTTRLVTRVHAVYTWRHPLTALLGVVLMESGDFAMMRRMLRGIKERAETLARDTGPQQPDGNSRRMRCSRSERQPRSLRRHPKGRPVARGCRVGIAVERQLRRDRCSPLVARSGRPWRTTGGVIDVRIKSEVDGVVGDRDRCPAARLATADPLPGRTGARQSLAYPYGDPLFEGGPGQRGTTVDSVEPGPDPVGAAARRDRRRPGSVPHPGLVGLPRRGRPLDPPVRQGQGRRVPLGCRQAAPRRGLRLRRRHPPRPPLGRPPVRPGPRPRPRPPPRRPHPRPCLGRGDLALLAGQHALQPGRTPRPATAPTTRPTEGCLTEELTQGNSCRAEAGRSEPLIVAGPQGLLARSGPVGPGW